MLTHDLLLYRSYKGALRLRFIDPEDEAHVALASELIEICKRGSGEAKKYLDEALNGRAMAYVQSRMAKGLVKLLSDRMEFVEPDSSAEEMRTEVFSVAQQLRQELSEETSFEDFEESLAEKLGRDLAEVREQLFSDLVGERPLLAFEDIGPEALLHRYNLSLVQSSLLHARSFELKFLEKSRPQLRRILRHLKFCRLVAEFIPQKGKNYLISVEGPAAIFSQAKKYGLQLAQFMAVVPLLEQYELSAEVEFPRKKPLKLTLSHEQGLRSHHRKGKGYVPEEVEKLLSSLERPGWDFDLQAEPLMVGASAWVVPDLALTYGQQTRWVELFHPWHKGALHARLQQLEEAPQPHLYLGVERKLLKDADLKTRVEGHQQCFLYTGFPSRRALNQVMIEVEKCNKASQG